MKHGSHFFVTPNWVELQINDCKGIKPVYPSKSGQYEDIIFCCWCKSKVVRLIGDKCELCTGLPSNPFVQMSNDKGTVLWNGIPFYRYARDKKVPELLMPEVALAYAHMRIEQQQKEIDDLKKTMSDFINACELSPEGEYANETVERLQKSLKK
jgi:hypothetical protein